MPVGNGCAGLASGAQQVLPSSAVLDKREQVPGCGDAAG